MRSALGVARIHGPDLSAHGLALSLPDLAISLVLGSVFHLPAILLTTTYDSVGSRYVVAPIVVATITFAGVFYAWLRDRSGSIWPIAIAHNTANTVFDLGAAAAVTGTPVALAYVAGETGVATFVAVAAVGVWLLLRSPVWDRITPGLA